MQTVDLQEFRTEAARRKVDQAVNDLLQAGRLEEGIPGAHIMATAVQLAQFLGQLDVILQEGGVPVAVCGPLLAASMVEGAFLLREAGQGVDNYTPSLEPAGGGPELPELSDAGARRVELRRKRKPEPKGSGGRGCRRE